MSYECRVYLELLNTLFCMREQCALRTQVAASFAEAFERFVDGSRVLRCRHSSSSGWECVEGSLGPSAVEPVGLVC